MTENMIRQQTNKICTAYEELTGRPAAGLSVNEFLSFRAAAISELAMTPNENGMPEPVQDEGRSEKGEDRSKGKEETKRGRRAAVRQAPKEEPARRQEAEGHAEAPADPHKASEAAGTEPAADNTPGEGNSFYEALMSIATPWE